MSDDGDYYEPTMLPTYSTVLYNGEVVRGYNKEREERPGTCVVCAAPDGYVMLYYRETQCVCAKCRREGHGRMAGGDE